MSANASISPTTSTEQYVREARKIRAIHRGDPAKTQQALKSLIAARIPATELLEQPAAPRSTIDWSTSAVLGHRTPVARVFADQVAGRLIGSILSFSDRQVLLAIAEAHGINRFEANLIIAAVQNRVGGEMVFEEPVPAKSKFPYRLTLFLLIEATFVAALCHLFL